MGTGSLGGRGECLTECGIAEVEQERVSGAQHHSGGAARVHGWLSPGHQKQKRVQSRNQHLFVQKGSAT